MIDRRDFLTETAAVVAFPLGSFEEDGANRSSTSENLSGSESLSDYGTDPGASSQVEVQRVPANNRILHQASWITVGDEGPEALIELRRVTNHEFWIDGQPIDNPDQHWSISRAEGDQWRLQWRFITPSKSIGMHFFGVKISFDHPFRTIQSDGLTTLDGTQTYSWKYEVIE